MSVTLFTAVITFALNATETINFNRNFEADSNGAPAKWVINTLEEYKPLGTVELLRGKMNKNSVRLVSKGKELHYYNMQKFPIKSGEILTIKAKISGKGKIAFGGYFYGASNKFIYGAYPFFNVPAVSTLISKSLTIEKRDNAPAVESGRILLAISPDADVIISDLDVEISPK